MTTRITPMGAVLGIVYRAIAAHLVRKAGLTQARARTGAVTLIQRFGSALNLNIHFHLLVLDGVYELTAAGPHFRRVAPPRPVELEALLGQIVTRIARHLERRGLVVRDAENAYLSAGPGEEDGLAAVVGHSITYRIAVGRAAPRTSSSSRWTSWRGWPRWCPNPGCT